MVYDVAIVGGGIVGLATGLAVTRRYPHARLLLLEKEAGFGCHQTGHNSGVIHSGIYYRPGSLKATLCREGNRAMVAFCREQGIPYDVCGKVIVATRTEEVERLQALAERGRENGLVVEWLSPEALREIEPHARGVAALRVPSTGIVNFRQVSEAMARLLTERGGELRLGSSVDEVAASADEVEIGSGRKAYRCRVLVNCAGLHSDRLARRAGVEPGMRIVPFRGEYYRLKREREFLVKHLIYPVPNPEFPFLGVHFTRMIEGGVEAGPNAVLSLKREGYSKGAFSLTDAAETLAYPGMWRLSARYWREGAEEIHRAFSKGAFVRGLQQLVPEVQAADLEPAEAGVRAQALRPDGTLVDDFHILAEGRMVHVCNAPSPAATASLLIGERIADQIPPV